MAVEDEKRRILGEIQRRMAPVMEAVVAETRRLFPRIPEAARERIVVEELATVCDRAFRGPVTMADSQEAMRRISQRCSEQLS